ncbi:N-6 DNA methylase [Rhodococcus hoagii]|nr:N-6 DNA methylase [Prescottella equi]
MSATFQGVRIVGGVVPPALLGRIQSGEVSDPASLSPGSYHLVGTETPRDAASRAWAYLRGAWSAWRAEDENRTPGSAGTGAAREKWLLPLLRTLDYGQVSAMPAVETSGGDHPVSHLWGHLPVHLLGPGVDLDRRNPGVRGAARAPQAMVQEFLNVRDEYLWAIVSNGLRLRLLRDSTALAGSAYLEFDLEAIFDGELYAEFLLLWQLVHVSRLEKRGGPDAPPSDCWLESWRGEAVDAGTRALNLLRDGVENALGSLGSGILRHSSNRWLVEALHVGEITDRQFHTALLRTVYRLLFCFVAEDRDSLLDPAASPDAVERYRRYFSTARLRRLSRARAGGPHPDLWQSMRLVLRGLGGEGIAQLAVPALGGLFDPSPREPNLTGQPFPDLILGAEIANTDFLAAIRALGWVSVRGQRIQPVDYRHLGAEELGSVYESLLELVPRLDLAEHTFTLEQVAGNERKTTGSYYTPPGLVSALLDTALDPLLDDAVKNADDTAHAQQRLLAITVCDPASGSGGFLVAAARRIAARLAAVRSGEDQPTPADVQHALRDVVGRCIYGVDINELAADLAKVSLWLEALEPGKPLGFLDARIKVGNALLGTTPALLAAGVPDDAFKPLESDDKETAKAIKKRNKSEGGAFAGQDALFLGTAEDPVDKLARQRRNLVGALDDVAGERARARALRELESSDAMVARRRRADAWVAAFVWPLHEDTPEPPTNLVLRMMEDTAPPAATGAEIDRLAGEYRFFHWDLEFPEVFHDEHASDSGPEGWTGGFSCMLGNPPWEHIELKEQEYFAGRDPEIAAAAGAKRKKLIARLESVDPPLFARYQADKRHLDGTRHFASTSGRYPFTGRGRVKTDPVFAELFRGLTAPKGRTGIIVPTGIATDATTQYFFKDMIEKKSLAALYDFENQSSAGGKIFESVDSRQKFCLLTIAGRDEHEDSATFAFFLHDPQAISTSEFALTPDEITLLNPNTGTVPIFRSRRDADITLGIYRRVPVLVNANDPVNGNPWGVSFMQGLFNMTSDSHLFHTREDLEAQDWALDGNVFVRETAQGIREVMVPLYEAKMLHHFDSRWATYDGDTIRDVTEVEKSDPTFGPLGRYWVSKAEVTERLEGRWKKDWLLGFRKICRATDERTLINFSYPTAGMGDSGNLLFPATGNPGELVGGLSSLAADYILRQKQGGINLNFFQFEQIAVLPPTPADVSTPWDSVTPLAKWVNGRVLELSFTDLGSSPFARELGDSGTPFAWDASRRFNLRAELDAAFFHLYNLTRDDADYILDTFTTLRGNEESRYGEYRTKCLVLEIFDAMQRAIDSGEQYRTILDPPPGHGPRHPSGSL